MLVCYIEYCFPTHTVLFDTQEQINNKWDLTGREKERVQFTQALVFSPPEAEKGAGFCQGTRHEAVTGSHINQRVTVKSMVLIVTQ